MALSQQKKSARTTDAAKDFTADAWFSVGERIAYDFCKVKLLGSSSKNDGVLEIFLRTEGRPDGGVTFLGWFPDGSYGWARVLPHLPGVEEMGKVFVEYVGQGDSDKPDKYPYGISERADLVEAHWRRLGVMETIIVSFDYSSLVTMELLSRQLERRANGESPGPVVKGVLVANGGLFTDGHSHPWFTTPLLKTAFGKSGTWFAQRSRLVFGQMMLVLWSKEYGVQKQEIDELFNVVTRRNGAAFLSNGAKFVDEHKANGKRLDFKRLFLEFKNEVHFLVVGSVQDTFEHKQIKKARQRLKKYGLDIRMLPGGHLTTSEHPEKLGALITAFCRDIL